MDLITGLATITSVFLLSVAIVSFRLVGVSARSDDPGSGTPDLTVQQLARVVVVPLLIGFFLGTADVFVTAQLPADAFVILLLGVSTIAILYGASRRSARNPDDPNWRR